VSTVRWPGKRSGDDRALHAHLRSDIAVYDAYRRIVVRTFTAAVGRAGEMTISSDGLTLFVNDFTACASLDYERRLPSTHMRSSLSRKRSS